MTHSFTQTFQTTIQHVGWGIRSLALSRSPSPCSVFAAVCMLITVTKSDSAVTLLDSCTRLLVQIRPFDSWGPALQLHSCLCLSRLSAPSCSQINVGLSDAMQETLWKVPNRSFCSGDASHEANLSCCSPSQLPQINMRPHVERIIVYMTHFLLQVRRKTILLLTVTC